MVVDFHSHILPGIDDGSASAEESLAMLRKCREQGIREVVLTPHFYPHRSSAEHFLIRRQRAMERLLEATGDDPAMPSLRLGAEVFYFPQMGQSDLLEKLTIERTRAILVEMPAGPWTSRIYRDLEDIHYNLGLTPIVAHVERYLGRLRDFGIPQRLAELPVLVQANASSFLEGGRTMKMLSRQQIHLLGSDCHNMTSRSPNLGPALERIQGKLGKGAVEWIRAHEQEILL